ncbi:MAG: hypothetical protein HQM16_16805 [Deltaproteobacteria bacterium]|nr:hypothetical protein [Deltaproteobacteria bacterium]
MLQHVPDRYQNMRRYAGCYAANVRLRIQRARAETHDKSVPEVIKESSPKRIQWAKLIARIFGESPTICPQCGEEMKLVGFVFDTRMLTDIQYMQRAPPRIVITRYFQLPRQPVVDNEQDQNAGDFIYDQTTPSDEDVDQSKNW